MDVRACIHLLNRSSKERGFESHPAHNCFLHVGGLMGGIEGW